MKRYFRPILLATCLVLLLGNTNCSRTNDGSATFVTTIAVEDASGNPKTDFLPGEVIQLVLTVRNRTDSVQQVDVTQPCFLDAFAVVPRNSSNVVFYGDTNVHCNFVSQAGEPLIFQPGEAKSFSTSLSPDIGLNIVTPSGAYEAMGGLVCPDMTLCFTSFSALASPTELSTAELRSPLMQFVIQ